MKKLNLLVLPLMAISFLTNCGGGSTPTEDVEFSTQSEVELDKYDKKAIINLNWTPTDHSIECSDFTFTLNNQSDITSTITLGELGSRPLKVTIDFAKALEANDKGDLKFKYNDKTAKKEGEGKVTGINIKLHENPPTPGTFTISILTEGTTISPESVNEGDPYYGEITVTDDNKMLDGDTLKSVKLKDSGDDITSYCEDYDPKEDYKSATFTIPTQYITEDIEVEVNLKDKPAETGTVIWNNWNDTPLVEPYELTAGLYAEYKGDTPTRPTTSSYVYQFSGWDPDPTVKAIVGGKENVFKAQFDPVATSNLAASMKLVIPSGNDDLTFSFDCTASKKITVDWDGNGTVDNSKSHTYSTSGTYNVSIYGEDITTVSAGEKGKDYISELNLTSKITAIPNNAFKSCTSLTKATVPSSVTSLGEYAFAYCTSLSEISNLTNITSISAHAFDSCALTTFIVQDKVTEIGEYAFANCTSLETVITALVLDTLKTIGAHAFELCGLTGFLVPDSVTSIGDFAFAYCTKLSSVSLPENITSIGEEAFGGCDSLAFNEYGNCKYLGNTSNKYLALIIYISSSITSITVHNSCKIICSGALTGTNKLTTVSIPDSVVSIGAGAFSECVVLKTVTINNTSSLIEIGEYAFSQCSALTSINIPNKVTSLGKSAFSYCYELSSVSISNSSSLESIGHSAFRQCEALNSINIPDQVKSIGVYAFSNCEKFTNITIPNSVKLIDYGAFENCVLLKNVNLTAFTEPNPESIPSLGSYAFDECHEELVFKVAKGMVGTFQGKAGWSRYANRIQEA